MIEPIFEAPRQTGVGGTRQKGLRMLNAIEISPKVWWVGGIDWNERAFHG